jgi:hypothetical protein
MGTHPSGPAQLLHNDQSLLDWLSTRPGAVGRVPKNYSKTDLPFMFKVLSVKTALSIQVCLYLIRNMIMKASKEYLVTQNDLMNKLIYILFNPDMNLFE